MVVYNGILKCFAYMLMTFTWNDGGTVDMKLEVLGMPATDYQGNPKNYDTSK
jgi:hypothetical protein